MKKAIDRFFRDYNILALAQALRDNETPENQIDKYMEKKAREALCETQSGQIAPLTD